MKKKAKIVPRNLMHLELIKSGALKPKTTRDKTKYSRKQKHKGGINSRPYHINPTLNLPYPSVYI